MPMTQDLFRQDATLRRADATITAIGPQGIVLDRTVFYPLGGGQAGDQGWLALPDGARLAIADTRKAKDEAGQATADICHVPAPGQDALLARCSPGTRVAAEIDWERRHRLMRLHTTTHLLCHLVALPVNGCSITPEGARMDFHTDLPLDKEALSAGIARLVAQALPVVVGEIAEQALDADPGLVKSMSVSPPRGTGAVRTIRIGADALIDLQPCGGTHVANTAEIGAVQVTKVEKKGAMARRVLLGFAA